MIHTTLSSGLRLFGYDIIPAHGAQAWGAGFESTCCYLLKLSKFSKACATSSHRTSYPRCKTKNNRKISSACQSRIWHDGGKDAWVMLQMMQLMSIKWTRPSFLPADATFLGRARAVVQLLLQQDSQATLQGIKIAHNEHAKLKCPQLYTQAENYYLLER